jgi:hypothetical protein
MPALHKTTALFVGVPFTDALEQKKELLPLFELEKITHGPRVFVGKAVSCPLDYGALTQFEDHVQSCLKRLSLTLPPLYCFYDSRSK